MTSQTSPLGTQTQQEEAHAIRLYQNMDDTGRKNWDETAASLKNNWRHIYREHLKPECCAYCGNVATVLLRCGACKVIKYCDKDCQRKDWKAAKHKKACSYYKKALEFWKKDSEKQDAQESATQLFIIATRLALGEDNDPRDLKFAIELYKKATEMDVPIPGGHPVAMLHLGLHYETGIGVKQDYTQALDWYSRVKAHPNPGDETLRAALFSMSRFYEEGLGGVEQSDETACHYVRWGAMYED